MTKKTVHSIYFSFARILKNYENIFVDFLFTFFNYFNEFKSSFNRFNSNCLVSLKNLNFARGKFFTQC